MAEPAAGAGTRTGLERHIQTGVGMVLIALVLWVGHSINEQGKEIARLQERIAALVEKVAVLERQIDLVRRAENRP